MSAELTITVTDPEQAEVIENALDAVEAELDSDIRRRRGRTATHEITLARAIEEMAEAYAGADREIVATDGG